MLACQQKHMYCSRGGRVLESDSYLILPLKRRLQSQFVLESRRAGPFWFETPHRQKEEKKIQNVKNDLSSSGYGNQEGVSILQQQAEKPSLIKLLAHRASIDSTSCTCLMITVHTHTQKKYSIQTFYLREIHFHIPATESHESSISIQEIQQSLECVLMMLSCWFDKDSLSGGSGESALLVKGSYARLV